MLIAARHLWTGGALLGDRTLRIEDGRVTNVGAGRAGDRHVHLAMPACTDLQVNGGGGTLLNADPTPGGIARIIAAHRARGTGWLMPTLITDPPDVMTRAVDAALAAAGQPGFLGLHLEGPHIAPDRRGTHDAAHIRPLDDHTIAQVRRLRAAGLPVMVTLAPECTAPDRITLLRAAGAVVSAGHSAATAEETRAAIDAGVGCFTHLFNAMPPMTSRAPGIVAAALLSDAFVGLIADGIHVAPEMLRLACAARPDPGRSFLVSDAMPTVGGPDTFELYGRPIRRDGATLRNAEGALAGAHLDMVTAMGVMHRAAGLPLAEVCAMATDVPRAVLGLPPQQIEAGASGDEIVFLDADLRRLNPA